MNTSDSFKSTWLVAVVLAVTAAPLVFVGLGDAPLWDDEDTALWALSLWRTGDMTAMLDGNLIAYRSGAELHDMRNRYMPPLAAVVASPSLGLLGKSTWAARLPFAICGLLTLVVIGRWAQREGADAQTCVLLGMGLIGNVSLLLFVRQCRYFALILLLSVLLAYLYRFRKPTWLHGALMGVVATGLVASNYLSFAVLGLCGAVDYAIWGRREGRLGWRTVAGGLVPLVVIGGWVVWTWNPAMAGRVWTASGGHWLADRSTLIWYNVRDLNACEFGVGALLAAGPLLALWGRDGRLMRAWVLLAVFIVGVALASPQAVGMTSVAAVRYLVPVIPLCVFIAVRGIRILTGRRWWLAVPLAAVAFGTNVLCGGPWATFDRELPFDDKVGTDRFRSTWLAYVGQLRDPPPSTYRGVASWMRDHLEAGTSVLVIENYATYPLMFHAPHVTYAWQLDWPPEAQFADLDPIHFRGRVWPDAIVVFGPKVRHPGVRALVEAGGYERRATIDRFWADLSRPELHYHAFEAITVFDRSDEGVYVFVRPAGLPKAVEIGP